MTTIELVRDWLKKFDGKISTHYEDCWQYHTPCMAGMLLKAFDETHVEPSETP